MEFDHTLQIGDRVLLTSGFCVTIKEFDRAGGFKAVQEENDPGSGWHRCAEVVGVMKFTQHRDPQIQALIDAENSLVTNRFLVIRTWESGVGAIVTFRHPQALKSLEARELIKQAVTEWIIRTDEGKALWEHSSKDLNLGDLASHVEDPLLVSLLGLAGIRDLSIETVDSNSNGWEYDNVLADEERVEAALKKELLKPEDLAPPEGGDNTVFDDSIWGQPPPNQETSTPDSNG